MSVQPILLNNSTLLQIVKSIFMLEFTPDKGFG